MLVSGQDLSISLAEGSHGPRRRRQGGVQDGLAGNGERPPTKEHAQLGEADGCRSFDGKNTRLRNSKPAPRALQRT